MILNKKELSLKTGLNLQRISTLLCRAEFQKFIISAQKINVCKELLNELNNYLNLRKANIRQSARNDIELCQARINDLRKEL